MIFHSCIRGPVGRGVAIFAVALCWAWRPILAIAPNEWRFQQAIEVPARGLVRVDLPVETLDAARPNLEDLRLLDVAGREVPYLVDRSVASSEAVLSPKDFRVEIDHAVTRITVVTGTNAPLKAVTMKAAGTSEFIKAARIEGSHDGTKWRQLGDREPIFRMRGGATKLQVSFPEGVWELLRLTIDDTRTVPVPFTGAQLHTGGADAPKEPMQISIRSRDESPGLTRLAVTLAAANLTPASLHIETPEPLFTRKVSVAVPKVVGDNISEQSLGSAVVYRVDLNGKVESHLDVPIETQIEGRELLLLISNGDSPPLGITAVRGERRMVQLLFLAVTPGRYLLLSGNNQCVAPNYDLSTMAGELKGASAIQARPALLRATPDYKPADNLATLSLVGANIDVSSWNFRKYIDVSRTNAQEIELDLDVLARAMRDFRDLRLVREGRQIPFLLERTSISRAIPLPQATANDPKRPTLSRWSLKLPRAGLPIVRVACVARSAVFQRDMRLWENVTDERGDAYARELASAIWRQVPNETAREFVIGLKSSPVSDTLFLETDNSDNPQVEFNDFRAYYSVARIVFKAPADSPQPIWLYYGNPDAPMPRYDVNLVADQLLHAERASASLGAEENIKSKSSRVGEALRGPARYIFWGVLGIVVITLLLLISRLLPKTQ